MWLTGWNYRKKVTISGSSGAGTNYQIPLKIGESSGVSGADFHLNGHSAIFPSGKNQSGDLRLTSSDGITLLDFWVEDVTGTSPNRIAKVWVEVSEDLGTNKDIFIYYGNSNALNVSNGDNTFLFFDDFEGTALDTNKWVAYADDYSVSSSVLRTNVGGVERTSAFSFNIQNGYIAETRAIYYGVTNNYGGPLPEVASSSYTAGSNANADATILYMRDGNSTLVVYFIGDGSSASYNIASGVSTGWNSSNNTWYITGVSVGGGTVKLWRDGTDIVTVSGITWSKNLQYVKLGSFNRDSSNNIQDTGYDWIRVRKFVSPEPAFSSAGPEEFLGSRRRLLLSTY